MQIITFYERQRIEYYVRLKLTSRNIGQRLKRDHTIILRELKRNTVPGERYTAATAQAKADRRASKTNKRKLETDDRLHDVVEEQLKEGFSPELIAGRLKEHPTQFLRGMRVSHEQIYEYIYEGEGRFEGWYHYLTRKHARRYRQHSRKKQAKTLIKERVSITERPGIVEERGRYGDWESDQMQFKRQRERISVQYERRVMLIRLHRVANKTAEENEQAIMKTLDALPPELIQSMTFDNGGENACHTTIRDTFNLQTFFCAPYAAWQKGGVENAIGLIRRYLPKTIDLATITETDIYAIQEKLNNRPRKKLNYQTPNEVLSGALNS